VWENVLEVPLPINNIFLEVELNGKPLVNQLDIAPNNEAPSVMEYDDYTIFVLSDMSLDAHEKRSISLKITPKNTGNLVILGVRYLLCGILPSYRLFKPIAPLQILITPPMPVLEVIFHSFPTTMQSGQVCQAIVEINNKGTMGLKDLLVKTSHPHMIQFGPPTTQDLSEYGKRLLILKLQNPMLLKKVFKLIILYKIQAFLLFNFQMIYQIRHRHHAVVLRLK
jgi:hypothetical protein